jgi:hypothetical protein
MAHLEELLANALEERLAKAVFSAAKALFVCLGVYVLGRFILGCGDLKKSNFDHYHRSSPPLYTNMPSNASIPTCG